MNRLLSGETVHVAATVEEVWAVLWDAGALQRVLPGCQQLEEVGPGRYRGSLEARLAFVTVRADVEASLVDAQPISAVRLELAGRPRGLAGAFRASIPLALEADDAGCRITYDVELELAGRLATFGAPLLRETMRRQVQALVAGLEREVSAARGAGREAAPGEAR